MQFGAVLFDTPENAGDGSGWACIAGESPFRVSGINDLQHDARWWTNITFNSVSDQRSFRSGSVKQEGYLRTRMDHIAQEIGLDGKRPLEAVPLFAQLFERVMKSGVQHYGLDIETIANEDFLSRDMAIQYRLDRRHDKKMPQMDNSFQNITFCSGRWSRDVVYTWIRRPRLQHAIDVLSAPVPVFGGKWEAFKDKSLLRTSRALDFLIASEEPVLARASVKNIDPAVSDLIGFGNTANKSENRVREWISQPELLWLSNYAEIDIKDAFLCKGGYQPGFVSEQYPLKEHLVSPNLNMGFNQLSITAGLLAENYWVALANRIQKRAGRKTEKIITPSASWMRSVDRMLIFMDAIKLINKIDIDINSYSVGTMNVSFPQHIWDEVKEAVQESGLFMPTTPPIKRT